MGELEGQQEGLGGDAADAAVAGVFEAMSRRLWFCQVGPVYQFRHAKLQDRLAHTYRKDM